LEVFLQLTGVYFNFKRAEEKFSDLMGVSLGFEFAYISPETLSYQRCIHCDFHLLYMPQFAIDIIVCSNSFLTLGVLIIELVI
jgi:hypothetical protein